MKFVYWNLNKRPVAEILVALRRDCDADVLVLSELATPLQDVVLRLNKGFSQKFGIPAIPIEDPIILTTLAAEFVTPISDTRGVSIRQIVPPVGPDFLVVAVHLRSKLFQGESDQILSSTRVARAIEEAEARVGHRRTVVIGDLNMNPFENGVVGADGLHAVMARNVALRGVRVVDGHERPFFYNPMWSHFGDSPSGPPGTYYHSSSNQVVLFWHMYDQVLIRPDLLRYSRDSDLRIITAAGDTNLLRTSGAPDATVGSDHLPVYFELQLLEE